jgi:hypothetical protein
MECGYLNSNSSPFPLYSDREEPGAVSPSLGLCVDLGFNLISREGNGKKPFLIA